MAAHLEQRTDETTDDWQTPAWLVELVRCFGDGIALDPCTTPQNPTGAKNWAGPDRDGLAWHWAFVAQGGLVYVNPPYGNALKPWSAKAISEGRLGANILFLCPARTETQWFGSLWDNAQAVALFRKRIRFVHPVTGASDSPKFPSALFLFTSVPRAVSVFRQHFAATARTVIL